MMGDLGAVTVVQEAHSRMMVAKRVLHPAELIGGSPEFAWQNTMGDVYIDDLVVLVLGSLAYPPDELRHRLCTADKAYADADLVVKKEKGEDGQLDASFWGASLRGREGMLGYSVDRRSSLAAITLFALAFGATGNHLRQLLGTWSFCLGFRREAMSIMGSCFALVSEMRPCMRVLVSGSLLDEFLVLFALAPILEADLRTPPLKQAGKHVVFATDAEGSGGIGGCSAPISTERWKVLYALAEEKGAYVFGGVQEQRSTWVADHRQTAALLTRDLDWRVVFSLGGHKIPAAIRGTTIHINILELRAVFVLLQRLIKQGIHYCRLVLLCDSLVAVSVLAKGRSSSRRLNFIVRRISALLLSYRITLDVVWVPTWANPSDAPSRGVPLRAWKESAPTLPSASVPSLRVPPHGVDAWRRLLQGSAAFGDDHPDLQKWHLQEVPVSLPVPAAEVEPPDKNEAWSKWKFDSLLTCGDIESQPGPRPRVDLLTNDVTQRTADRYHQSLVAFEMWLGSQGLQLQGILQAEGLADVIRHAIRYLRSTYLSEDLTPSAANYLGASLRRFALLTSSLGFSLGDVRAQMQPYWRVVRSLHLAIPPEFRAPVPAALALALALWGFLRDDIPFALLVLLGHHCLLRPEELRSVMYCDIHIFPRNRYSWVFGMVGVTAAKTRRLASHTKLQHVLIEDQLIAAWCEQVLRLIPVTHHRSLVWSRRPEDFLSTWHQGLLALDLRDVAWTPSGLRGGGATEQYLHCRDVQALRRRGRWTQLSTLDRYLQEGALLLAQSQLPHRVHALAHLATSVLFSSLPPPPRHLPTTGLGSM
eukprot:3873124-Amphidinium_carterae.1